MGVNADENGLGICETGGRPRTRSVWAGVWSGVPGVGSGWQRVGRLGCGAAAHECVGVGGRVRPRRDRRVRPVARVLAQVDPRRVAKVVVDVAALHVTDARRVGPHGVVGVRFQPRRRPAALVHPPPPVVVRLEDDLPQADAPVHRAARHHEPAALLAVGALGQVLGPPHGLAARLIVRGGRRVGRRVVRVRRRLGVVLLRDEHFRLRPRVPADGDDGENARDGRRERHAEAVVRVREERRLLHRHPLLLLVVACHGTTSRWR